MPRNFPGGASDYLICDDPAYMQFTGQNVTLACWAKVTTLGTQYLISKWGLASSQEEWCLTQTGSSFSFNVSSTGAGLISTASTGAVSAGRWYHVLGKQVATIGGYIYLDGVLAGTFGSTRAFSDTACRLCFGIAEDGYPYNGRMAHAAVWNYPLSDHSIRLLAQGAKPTEIGYETYLRGYWPMDDYPHAREASGHGNWARLNGSVGITLDEPAPMVRLPDNSQPGYQYRPPGWAGAQLLADGILSG